MEIRGGTGALNSCLVAGRDGPGAGSIRLLKKDARRFAGVYCSRLISLRACHKRFGVGSMRGEDRTSGALFSYVDIEGRIPARHPLRAMRRLTNAQC